MIIQQGLPQRPLDKTTAPSGSDLVPRSTSKPETSPNVQISFKKNLDQQLDVGQSGHADQDEGALEQAYLRAALGAALANVSPLPLSQPLQTGPQITQNATPLDQELEGTQPQELAVKSGLARDLKDLAGRIGAKLSSASSSQSKALPFNFQAIKQPQVAVNPRVQTAAVQSMPQSTGVMPVSDQELLQSLGILAQGAPADGGAVNDIVELEVRGETEVDSGVLPKAAIRDSESFISLQNMPRAAGRSKAAAVANYATDSIGSQSVKNEAASQVKGEKSEVSSSRKAVAGKSDVDKFYLGQMKAGMTPEVITQAVNSGILPMGEAVVRAQGQQVQLPKALIDGQVTQGSMARDRLTSHSLMNVRDQLQSIAHQGGGEIQIRLKPGNLGEIKLLVAARGQSVGLRIQADNGQARKILEESLGALRERLAESNLKLSHIEFAPINSLPQAQPQYQGDSLSTMVGHNMNQFDASQSGRDQAPSWSAQDESTSAHRGRSQQAQWSTGGLTQRAAQTAPGRLNVLA